MDHAKLVGMSPDRLETLLSILKESRLLTEAETRKQEELRKIKELDLVVLTLQQQQNGDIKNDFRSDGDTRPSSNPSGGACILDFDPLAAVNAGSRYPDFPFIGLSGQLPTGISGYHPLPAADTSILGGPSSATPAIFGLPDPSVVMSATLISSTNLSMPDTLDVSTVPAAPATTSHSIPLHYPLSGLPSPSSLDLLNELLNIDFSSSQASSVERVGGNRISGSPSDSNAAAKRTTCDGNQPGPQPFSAATASDPSQPDPASVPSWPYSPPSTASDPEHHTGPSPIPTADDLPQLNTSRTSIRLRIRCLRCYRGVCLFLLYGTNDSAPDPVIIAAAEHRVFCPTCFQVREGGGVATHKAAAETDATVVKLRKRRVRKVTQSTPLKCHACTREIGRGGLRLVDGEEKGRDGEWNELPFEVEAVCDFCVKHFDFCTQCGGGGTFRTGKWRPRELFLPGRRNCTLQHVRYGDLPHMQVMTLRCAISAPASAHDNAIGVERPNATVAAANLARYNGRIPTDTEQLSQMVRDVCDMLRANVLMKEATPQRMTSTPTLGTWKRLMTRVEDAAQELETMILGAKNEALVPLATNKAIRRYLGTVDAIKTPRKASRSRTYAVAPAPTTLADAAEEADLFLAAFTIHEWHIASRHVFMVQGVYVQSGLSRGYHLIVSEAILDRIEREARAEELPLPSLVWIWHHRSLTESSNKGAGLLKGLGFWTVEEYCAMRAEETEAVMEGMELFRSEVDVARGIKEEIELLVSGWEDLRALSLQDLIKA
ncbi:hypothetical protein HDU96_001636 [Phlyctochytrium bullatum]|nr:hypothetical protein HDU96_001636 [Phlyctochytrium bullatum]